ncbi:MAG: tRNA (N6-threonylcarbamoyladenosine(37)-N6)-methyltransferase TrmO [Acidobacteriota bacterium]
MAGGLTGRRKREEAVLRYEALAASGSFWRVSPVGVIRTPFSRVEEVPGSSGEPLEAEGTVEVFPGFEEALNGVEGYSHLWLLFVLHCREGFSLLVRRRGTGPLTGLFATHCPCRPNPLGLTLVRLLGRSGRSLRVQGVDMVDGTPLLDIKPYVAASDPSGGVGSPPGGPKREVRGGLSDLPQARERGRKRAPKP